MRIAVWGAGAIGGTIGAHLALGGVDVTLVDTSTPNVEQIRSAGLRITGRSNLTVAVPIAKPEDVNGTFDVVMVAVKALHTTESTRVAAAHLAPDGFVVGTQNGLTEHEIAAEVGPDRVVGALLNQFYADLVEPGLIKFEGRGVIVLGELDGTRSARVANLCALLHAFDVRETTNIFGYKWAKLAWGAALAATSVQDEPMGEIIAHPDYLDVFVQLAREVVTVSIAAGVTPEEFPGFEASQFLPGVPVSESRAAMLRSAAELQPLPKKHTGMWRDLAVHHRKTEIPQHLGAVVSAAAEHDVPLALVPMLIEVVGDIENGRRHMGPDTLAVLAQATPASGK